jgi:CRP-like cAMP-binding protein
MLRSDELINSRFASIAALSSSFLAGLEETTTHDILAAAKIQRISAKQTIHTLGCPGTHLFLIQSGQGRLYHLTKHGELVLIAWLVPGDVTGLAAILEIPPPYMATAEATSDCDVLSWEHSVLRKLVSSHPLLAENALRIARDYLRTYLERHASLLTKSAETRLAEALVRLSDQCGQFHPDGIEICVTNEQLAALADISPFTASRVLGRWERAGTVSKRRGSVLLHAPEALMID